MSRRLLDGKQPKPRPGADKGGRKSEPDMAPDLPDKIVQVIRIGMPIESAFALHNVKYTTMRNWFLKGHAEPDSKYGALIERINKALAEYELRDVSVLDKHALGAPAQYEMEPGRDAKGRVMYKEGPNGKEPIMVVARDADGNPIVRSHAIKSDWRAAMERLSRRKPVFWSRRDSIDVNVNPDQVLTFDNAKPETKEAMSFDEKIAAAIRQLEEDV